MRRKDFHRALLRAFNGAMLGIPTGALIGGLLGAGFSQLVLQNWQLGVMYGVGPGALAGALIGTTMVVRDHVRGVGAGVAMGTVVGLLDAYRLGFADVIFLSIVWSGILGGFALSILLRWIRSQWPWWTRWESDAP